MASHKIRDLLTLVCKDDGNFFLFSQLSILGFSIFLRISEDMRILHRPSKLQISRKGVARTAKREYQRGTDTQTWPAKPIRNSTDLRIPDFSTPITSSIEDISSIWGYCKMMSESCEKQKIHRTQFFPVRFNTFTRRFRARILVNQSR